MAVVTMRQLLESGVHFGHQTRRWNPKMKRFIMTERNGIYIIDLQQSLAYIDRSYAFVKETVAKGGVIMFVGTKKQAQEAIAEQATRVGMPYVNQRWLGGMLTNFQTVHQRINRLKELDEIDFDDVAGSNRTKKELLQMRRERTKLDKTLGGIRDMTKVPSAVWIVDTNKEHLAVEEARKLRIPIIGILDSNCDPDLVDFPIPGNDDAIRAVGLLTRVVADAVAEGLIARSGAKAGDADETVGAEEPLAEWERELLGGDAEKAAAAATGDAAAETPAAEATGAASEAPQADAAADAVTEAPAETATEAPAETATEAPAEAEAADRGARRGPPPRPRPPPPRRPPRPRPTRRTEQVRRPRAHVRGRRPASSHPPQGRLERPAYPLDKGRRTMANFTAADVKKLREPTGAGHDGLQEGARPRPTATSTRPSSCSASRVPPRPPRAAPSARPLPASSPPPAAPWSSSRARPTSSPRTTTSSPPPSRSPTPPTPPRPPTPRPSRPSTLDGKTVGEVVEDLAITIGEKIELGRVAYFDGTSRRLHAQACRRPAAGRRRARRVRRATRTPPAPPRCRSPR